MNPRDAGGRPAADGALDEVDLAILDGIREVFQAVDPMPADLPERIRFSLALRDLEVEVARLVADEDQRVPPAPGGQHGRMIPFGTDRPTIMTRISSNSDGTDRR